jgi:hypothetical protein
LLHEVVSQPLTHTVSLDKPLTFEQFFKSYLYPFKLFLEFATDRPNYFSNVINKNNMSEKQSSLEIVFKERVPSNALSKREINLAHDLLFLYHDIQDSFQEIYTLWLSKQKRLGSVIDIYLTTTQEQLFSSIALQFLAQALESYHREMYRGQYMTDSDYETVFNSLINALPDTVDKAFRQKLKKGTLKYANEYSQRKRFTILIKEVLNPISDYIEEMVGDVNLFITDIVNLRNYYTHLGEDNKVQVEKIITDPRAFNKYIARLSVVLLACLLIEFGFKPEKIEEIIRRNHIRHNSTI